MRKYAIAFCALAVALVSLLMAQAPGNLIVSRLDVLHRFFPPKSTTAALPTWCEVGDVKLDTTAMTFKECTSGSPAVWDGIGATAPTQTKCINLDPAATTTDWLFFKTKAAITVTAIDCIVDAATSAVLTLRECDADGANCGATEAAITCATTNTAHAAAIDDAAIDAGDWLRVLRGVVVGTPAQASLCVTYTEP